MELKKQLNGSLKIMKQPKNNIQLIIPMSGIGKRFIDAGYINPKPLIEVDGKPIIQHVIEMFVGVTDITFICNEKHLAETNMSDILRNICPKGRIFSVPNENRKGPVDAVNQISDFIDDSKEVIVSYCDYGTVWDFNSFLDVVSTGYYDGIIPCYTGFHPHMLGSDNYAFCREDNKTLLEIKEKESFTDNKMNEYASNGAYYFKSGAIMKKYFKELVDLDINLKGEYYVSLVYNLLLRDNLNVGIFEIEKMLQWGTPHDLKMYNFWMSNTEQELSKQINAKNPPNTTLILPLAGKGSRFSEQGYDTPKPLIPVDGEPMILKAVGCLPVCEKSVFICLNEHLENYPIELELKNRFNNVSIVGIEDTTEGQACTCEIGIQKMHVNLDDPIQISACDNGVIYDEKEYQSLVDDESIDVIVWSFRDNPTSKISPNMYSWLEVDDENNITKVNCKKFVGDDPLRNHALIGTMFFRKAKYFIDGLNENRDLNIRANNEFYVDEIINRNIKAGLKVKVFQSKSYICWGTPNDLKTYNYWNEYAACRK